MEGLDFIKKMSKFEIFLVFLGPVLFLFILIFAATSPSGNSNQGEIEVKEQTDRIEKEKYNLIVAVLAEKLKELGVKEFNEVDYYENSGGLVTLVIQTDKRNLDVVLEYNFSGNHSWKVIEIKEDISNGENNLPNYKYYYLPIEYNIYPQDIYSYETGKLVKSKDTYKKDLANIKYVASIDTLKKIGLSDLESKKVFTSLNLLGINNISYVTEKSGEGLNVLQTYSMSAEREDFLVTIKERELYFVGTKDGSKDLFFAPIGGAIDTLNSVITEGQKVKFIGLAQKSAEANLDFAGEPSFNDTWKVGILNGVVTVQGFANNADFNNQHLWVGSNFSAKFNIKSLKLLEFREGK
jgi:hypothetical protein